MSTEKQSAAEAEVVRLTELIEEWRKHPAITLDDDGSAHVDLTKVAGRDNDRIAQYRARTWKAEHAVERVRELAWGWNKDGYHGTAGDEVLEALDKEET